MNKILKQNTQDENYLDADAFAFIFEQDSEEEDDDDGDVGGDIARGFPHPELSVEEPET